MENLTWNIYLELNGLDGGWTDVTEDISLMDGPIEIVDGIQSAALIDLVAAPGSISFMLDNSPANSAGLAGYYSPGHANCRAGFAKNLRIYYAESYGGIPYYQGVYWLQKPIPSAGVFGAAVTRCKAVDWLELTKNIPLPAIGVQTDQRGDHLLNTLVVALAAEVKPESEDFDVGDSIFTSAFDGDNVSRDSVYDILVKIARSEYGRIYLQTGTERFENYLLLENGNFFLLENGSKMILG
jgi:hypothetical protein